MLHVKNLTLETRVFTVGTFYITRVVVYYVYFITNF